MVLIKPTTTITMLPSHAYYANEICALQPALCRVSKQLRAETLSTFYNSNIFTTQLDTTADVATAKAWLRAIGDDNVRSLKQIVLCGWTRVSMGHMISRRWVRVLCDLWTGDLVVEKGGGEHPEVTRRIEGLKGRLKEMVEDLGEDGWGVRDLSGLMDCFAGLCVGF